MSSRIRFAKLEDLPEIINLCAEHAEFEQTGKLEKMRHALFSKDRQLKCLIATTDENDVIGYATFMPQFSTWDAVHYIYMDCLYIRPSYRSQGIGERLVQTIKANAATLDCAWIQWQTPKFNTRAIQFYERIGAVGKSKERFFLAV